MEAGIIALGIAVPANQYQQDKIAELISCQLNLNPVERRILRSIYRSAKIKYRYSVLTDDQMEKDYSLTTAERMKIYKAHALSLALQSIQHCIAGIHFDLPDITHIIVVSCTGMYAPGIDIEIIQQLHLDPAIKRTAIHFMGCYGAFNALKVADAICRSDREATVLMVCVELCSLHFQKKTNRDNLVANAIFADGAAAALLRANPATDKYLSLSSFHCDLIPQSNNEMTWEIADQGFDIGLSSYVPELIESGISTFIAKLMKQQGFASPIDFYAIHPGGHKILQACEKALGIQKIQNQPAWQVLENYGNMSSATILFVLKAIWDEIEKCDDGKNILGCAFGPGLTLESMLLNIHYKG